MVASLLLTVAADLLPPLPLIPKTDQLLITLCPSTMQLLLGSLHQFCLDFNHHIFYSACMVTVMHVNDHVKLSKMISESCMSASVDFEDSLFIFVFFSFSTGCPWQLIID